MASGRLWVLNLDAELELGRPEGYQPSNKVLAQVESKLGQVARTLAHEEPVIDPLSPGRVRLYPAAHATTPGDYLAHDYQSLPAPARGLQGMAWCPTPHALGQLSRHGATLPEAPSLAVLRQANSRAFCASLGQTLPGARFETDPAQARAFLTAHQTKPWLLKRPLGFAGRGQRAVRRPLTPADHRWIEQSAAHGGLQIEPLLELVLELVIHAHLRTDGQVSFGPLCRQHVDAHRAWQSTSALGVRDPLSGTQQQAIIAEAERVARALHQIGYFGPFGLDTFLYLTPSGSLALNPRSEINARYCMGFGAPDR